MIIDLADLPYSGNSSELEGNLHGDVPASLIFFEGGPGTGPRLHRHAYTEIFVIQAGRATFVVGDRTIDVSAGQIVIAQPGVPHKFTNTGDGTLRQIDIHLNDRFVTEWLVD